jgi:hypothetical protein
MLWPYLSISHAAGDRALKPGMGLTYASAQRRWGHIKARCARSGHAVRAGGLR